VGALLQGLLGIPARLRALMGLQPRDRLELTYKADGLRLRPHAPGAQTRAHTLIGCAIYQGSVIPLEQLDPALDAHRML